MNITPEEIKEQLDKSQIFADGFIAGTRKTLNWLITKLEKGETSQNDKNTGMETAQKTTSPSKT